LNSLNLDMVRSLHQALTEARADPTVRLMVLQGAGERGFCAGGDLKALGQPDYLEGIRARIIDKNPHPRWQPATLEAVRLNI